MSDIKISRRGAILEIELDRPKANAIDVVMSKELCAAFMQLRDDPDLRVATLSGGNGRFFSAGFDLKAAASGEIAEDDDFGPGGFGGLTELFDLDKPVVAAVNGMAVGGGFELVLACDLVVAVEEAEFFLPEARLGNVADAGGLQRLPKRLPRAVAMDMLLTGRRLSAPEALSYGLISRMVPASGLKTTVQSIADDLANAAQLSIRTTKQAVRVMESLNIAQSFAALRDGSVPLHPIMMRSLDHEEGPRAFAEGRAPKFLGR